MSWRASAVSPPERAAGDRDHFRARDLFRAPAPARPGASLHVAHRWRRSRSGAHHAAARQPEGGARLCAEARRLDRGTAERLPAPAPFVPGTEVPLRGVPHRIVHRGGARGTVWTEVDGDGRGCSASPASRRMSLVASATFSSARRVAISTRQADAMRRSLGVSIRRIAVRDQSSRWGSCSNSGLISYSWRIDPGAAFVLDYLAAHEVAHLVELNHSPRFWRLVRDSIPTPSAPKPGSKCMAPNCTATVCRRAAAPRTSEGPSL